VRDLYRILGIPDNATMADIKSAYRRLAKQYHPDLNPGSRQSEEKFKEILDAYTILSDEELRAQYDRKRKGISSHDFFANATPQEKKRDPGKREYPPEYMEMMRQRNRNRVVRQIQRRKKILRWMIVTFALYLVATGLFEAWLHSKHEADTLALNQRLEEIEKNDTLVRRTGIQNLDSPFDSIFGAGVTSWLSPNQLVVINPVSDAVVCLVQSTAPHRTIRNEFIHARQSFIMKELPNGSFWVKIYVGVDWKDGQQSLEGKKFGGFSSKERYFKIDREPIVLQKPTYEHPNTITTDTVRIDPDRTRFLSLTRDEFYQNGDSVK
jgi:hypothetical protein